MPSQCALQYFSLLAGTQLQAGFAHFFVPAIFPSLSRPTRTCEAFRAWINTMLDREKGMLAAPQKARQVAIS